VQLLEPPAIDDTFGASKSGPMDLGGASVFLKAYASIDPMTARESDQFRQNLSEVFHRVRIRYVEGVTSSMVILVENDKRLLAILAVTDQTGKREELVIQAKEIDAWTTSKSQ
jgi:SPP1 family predicted phage head-tail adaptor